MLKATLRSFSQKKQHTVLNILGLSIGIAVCVQLGLYVHNEYTYDSFHEKSDRIFRVNQSDIWGEWHGQMPLTGPNVAIAVQTDLDEIEAITRVLKPRGFIVSSQASGQKINSFREENLIVADPDFFKIFSFQLREGDPSTALQNPRQVVITKDVARKYFSTESAIGKTLYLKGTILESNNQKEPQSIPFTVSGVMNNVPGQSHIQFDMVASSSSFADIKANESTWAWTAFVNYALVKEDVEVSVLEKKLREVPEKWAAPTLQRLFGQTFEELHANNKSWELYLQPITEVYLSSKNLGNLLGPTGDKTTVGSFTAIGILILLLCSINFMNMSTAQSTKRAREVGIRKIMGAHRSALIGRFLFETFLLVIISTILGIALAEIQLDYFNQIAGKSISLMEQLTNPVFLLIIVIFCCLLVILAGIYPAFFLSSFQPLKSLKGNYQTGSSGKAIRNALVVFQFTITLSLIIGTVFIKKQLNYVSDFNLGFDKEHVIHVHNIEYLNSDVETVKNRLAGKTDITGMGQSHQVPPNIYRGDIIDTNAEGNNSIEPSRMKIDESYFDLLNLKLAAGRNFEADKITDVNGAVLLNETAVRNLGWGSPENYYEDSPIGKYIYRGQDKMEVIGVVKDFHFKSPRFEIGPLVVYHIDNQKLPDSGTNPSVLSLKINSNSIKSANEMSDVIAEVKKEFTAVDPFFPFDYSFLDQDFERSFKKEAQVNNIMNAFTLMALIIACLGLYGLAMFSAEQRTKEFSIRKVLGASVAQIMLLFSHDFTRLVLLGFVISVPISWYFVDIWLSDFANRTSIDLWVFGLAGLIGFVVSWGTISFQSLRVANKNPVDTLKDE